MAFHPPASGPWSISFIWDPEFSQIETLKGPGHKADALCLNDDNKEWVGWVQWVRSHIWHMYVEHWP